MGRDLSRSLILAAILSTTVFSVSSSADDCQTILNPEAKLEAAKTEDETHVSDAFREHLKKQLPDQEEAVEALSHEFERFALGLGDGGPVGKFLVSSLPGVDKTVIADSIATFFTGDPMDVIRIDCRAPQISQLMALAEPEAKKSVHIVQFDHIEEASQQMSMVLDQILKAGAVQVQEGKVISFQNSFIIMTTEIGEVAASDVIDHKQIGFRAKLGVDRKSDPQVQRDAIQAAKDHVRASMPAHFYKSFDKVLILKTPSEKALEAQVEMQIQRLQSKMVNHPEMEVGVLLSPKMKQALLASAKLGVETLDQDFDRLEVSVGRMIVKGAIKKGSVVELDGHINAPQVVSVKEGLNRDSIKALLQ